MSDGFTDDDRKMLVETHTKINMIKERTDDHETRIRSGEKFRHTLLGIAAASGAGFTALVEGVKAKIGM